MQLSEQQVMDLFRELGEIKARIDAGPAECRVHSEQIKNIVERVEKAEEKLDRVQTVIGKKELIVAAFGALGFGIAWAFKAMVAMLKG